MSSATVVWLGALREPSGYADEARSYLLALEDAGLEPVAREPGWVIGDAQISGRQAAAVEKALARKATGEYVVVHHVVPHPSQSSHDGVPNVARTMFETDRLPSAFKSRLIEVDEIWVPAAFNLDTFARGGIPEHRLRVLPETIDFELFTPGTVEPWPLRRPRSFSFLTNFDFTDRKGWDVLLDAWARAFGPDEDVCLVLKCLSQHGASVDSIRSRIDAHLAGRVTAPVVVETEVLPLAAMPRLYAAADAYVMASRGEGWGRPYMEAMAMGLPTIGSRWSGNLEFMHDGNSWLVDGKLVNVPDNAQSHTPLYRGHRWFDPDVEALAAAMREVAAGGDAVQSRAASARAELIERFGPGPIAKAIDELAGDLLDRRRGGSREAPSFAWRGDYGSGHSLAVVNDGVVDGLERAGVPVKRLVPESITCRTDAVGVAAHWPPSFAAPTLGPYVLYQPWEYGTVPESWVEGIRTNVDEVWVPSSFTRRAFVDSGVAEELVHVIPNGVDLDRFHPAGPAWPLPERGTVFLFVGGTIHRKGIDLLLRAYGRAFTADDDVCLVVKGFGAGTWYRGQTAESMLTAFDGIPNRPDLVLLDEEVPHDRLPALYRAASVLVQPYRAEGFCLPALEALACGVPVIVTDGGSTDDFTTEECAWRVPSRRIPVDPDAFAERDLALVPGAYQLEPDLDALTDALRAAADPAGRAARAAAARAHAERFGWDAAAAKARERLEALAGRTPVRSVEPADVPERRGFLFHVPAEWPAPETWAPALHAYLEAFSAADDVTLVLPAEDVETAGALVTGELERSGVDTHAVADIALADPGSLGPVSLELAADAVISADRSAAPRARIVLPPTAAALRAALTP
jgi:glycosyltransferase involved in cell wall biosynthesis